MRDLAAATLAAGRMHGTRIAILVLLVVAVILITGWVMYAARGRRGEKP